MLLNLIKKFTKKILYNKTTHFYDQKYITYENINNKFYRKKKIFNKDDYLHFLIKKTRELFQNQLNYYKNSTLMTEYSRHITET
jgi:hypothetical protein